MRTKKLKRDFRSSEGSLSDDEEVTDATLQIKTKMRELQEEDIQIDLVNWCSNAAQEASLADCAILDVRNRSAGP